MGRTWIYHKTEEPQIIDSDDRESYEKEGWRDSPAPFMTHKDFDVLDGDDAGAQNAADAIQGVADSLNGALNIGEMDKVELQQYAKEHFGADLDGRKSKENLLAEIKGQAWRQQAT